MTSDTDDIIDQLLGDSCKTVTGNEVSEASVPIKQLCKRERLVALAVGGQMELYLGKTYGIDQLESFQELTIAKLYARYEARLGSVMTKTLGISALELATIVASHFFPIPKENRPKLVKDLETDPFVEHALNYYMCSPYAQPETKIAQ